MSDREKRIKKLEKEAKQVFTTVQETEKNLTQLNLLLDYLKTRYASIISEMVSLGKTDVWNIVRDSAEETK